MRDGSPSTSSIWRLATRAAKPIVVMNDGVAPTNLFCIHAATGDIAGLARIAEAFGRYRLHGLQVPKGEMSVHLATSIGEIARHHVARLSAYQPDGPISLLGWSAGAVIALEMAQQLRTLGRDVPLLVALDGAPCNSGAGLARWHPLYLLKMAANVPRWLHDNFDSDRSLGALRRRRMEEKLAFSFGIDARERNGGQTLDADAMNGALRREDWSVDQKAFVHAIHRAILAYRPRPYPGRVLAFEMATQPLHHLRQVGAVWRKLAPACHVVRIKGNHSGLIKEPAAAAIAGEIIRELGTVDARPAKPPRIVAEVAT